MIKQYAIVMFVLSCQIVLNGQDTSYSIMNIPSLLRGANVNKETVQLKYNRNLQFLFDEFTGYSPDERKAKKDMEQEALLPGKLKKRYDELEKFPDSIATGWHSVVLTDNNQFYKNAKALISKNFVILLVIDDCIRIRCVLKEPIKNARAIISFKDINSGNEPLEAYFLNDLENPALIDEPMQPGYICFWTSTVKFLNERLLVNGIKKDLITKLHDMAPNCFETGVPFYLMKPGIYNFRATKTGNDEEAAFEIKPGMCLYYRLQ
ncbi:hypothetical protein BH10BAC3_BH10BAC3_39120 [soil metagenome]